MTRFQRAFFFSFTVSAVVGIGLAVWGPGPTGSARVGVAGVSGKAEMPGMPGMSELPAAYDPATVAELKREGIDLTEIAELTALERVALTATDPAARVKAMMELKRRFGMEPDAALLGRLELGGGVPKLALTERGRRFVLGMADRVGALYDRFLKEVDL
jgi:hypothetical protein